MKVRVIVKANARTNSVVKNPDDSFTIRISEPAIEGRANKKLIEVLSDYFHVGKKSITIKSGIHSTIKFIEILS